MNGHLILKIKSKIDLKKIESVLPKISLMKDKHMNLLKNVKELYRSVCFSGDCQVVVLSPFVKFYSNPQNSRDWMHLGAFINRNVTARMLPGSYLYSSNIFKI
jgi:hypothetical protein